MERRDRRAPAWLNALRATEEWRLAHVALDEDGREAVPEFAWAQAKPPSFAGFVDWLGATFADRVAIVDYSGVRFSSRGEPSGPPQLTTYAELVELVRSRAASLLDRGLGPWDHLALCLPNRLEVLALQYAAWSLGVVVSPINPDHRDRVGEILRSADHRLVFVEREPAAFAAAHGLDPDRVLAVEASPLPPSGAGRGCHTGAQIGRLEKLAPPDFLDPVLILHTSGTTGKPKGAMLSPYGLLTGALALQEGFQLSPDDRFLMVNPLYHINSIAFALALLGVGAQVVIPPFGQHWATAAAAGITISSMVQRHLTPLLAPASAADRRNLECLRRLLAEGTLKWIAVGSGPVAPEVQTRCLDMGVLLLLRWGMSENHLGSTNMRPGHSLDYYRAHVGSTGPTNRYLNLFVLDEDGHPRRTGRGRLVQRGNILVAYSTPEANVGAFAGGYHDTGDVAEITDEGHVYIVGRTKETIIRSGENVYPQDVDNYLMCHPRVIFAQTVGYPDPDHSEEVGAFVVVEDGAVSERELLDHAAGLGLQKRPKKLILLRPEDDGVLLRYTGPGKPQRLLNQLAFWRMHFLDEAAALLGREGILPAGARAMAVPDGAEVGLLVCVPVDSRVGVGFDLPDLAPYLVRGSRLSPAELERQLGQRGLSLADLRPSRVRVVRLPDTELAEVRALSRAEVAARYWDGVGPVSGASTRSGGAG